MPRAAARQTLRHTRPMIEIHIEMEEEKPLARTHTTEIRLRQMFVLCENARQICLGEAERTVLQHNRLHREDIKARLVHGEHVLRKVQILPRIRSAQIVVIAAPRIDELLKVLHHNIIRAVAAHIRPHGIVHLAPSVRGEDNRDIVVVQPCNILIGEQHAVRRECQLELLARLLLAFPNIRRDLFHRAEVHQRLSAEKVDLAVLSGSAAVYDKIHRRAPDRRAHNGTVPAVAAAVAETVLAAQIAVLRHHEAQRLHESARFKCRRYVNIRGKERPRRHEFVEFPQRLPQLCRRIAPRKTRKYRIIIRPVKIIHDVINHLVDDMDGTAVNINKDMHIVLFELMREGLHSFSFV